MNYKASIIGTGKGIPTKLISNKFVGKKTKKKDSWIYKKSGITRRFHINPSKKETASSLSVIAAKKAISSSNIKKDDIGLVVGCTFTPDYRFPGLAVKVHKDLGLKNSGAFDLSANCTGFQQGIDIACKTIILNPDIKFVLVIGCCVQSPLLDWEKPENCIFYGDGAGAAIVGRVPKNFGLISSINFCVSSAYDDVRLRGGGNLFPYSKKKLDTKQFKEFQYDMDGIETWKYAITYMPSTILKLLKKNKLKINEIDYFIFHQANKNLLTFIITMINVHKYGNTGDASLAIALDEAVKKKKIKKGDKVIISGIGAGFIFGASLIKWF